MLVLLPYLSILPVHSSFFSTPLFAYPLHLKTFARHRYFFSDQEFRSFTEDLKVLEGLPSYQHRHGFLTVQQQLLVLQRMQREYSFLTKISGIQQIFSA